MKALLAYARTRGPNEKYDPIDRYNCAMTQFEKSRNPEVHETFSHNYDIDVFTAAMTPDNNDTREPGHSFVYTWGGLVKRLEALASPRKRKSLRYE